MTGLKTFTLRLLVNAVLIALVIIIGPGVGVVDGNLVNLLIIGVIFGLVNAFIKPLLVMLASPAIVATMGVATVILDVILLLITVLVVPVLAITSGLGWVTLIVGGVLAGIANSMIEYAPQRMEDMRRARRIEKMQRESKIRRG
jgi:putative membrane protein